MHYRKPHKQPMLARVTQGIASPPEVNNQLFINNKRANWPLTMLYKNKSTIKHSDTDTQ